MPCAHKDDFIYFNIIYRAQGDVQDVQGAEAAQFKTKITCHDAFRVPAIVVLLPTAVLRTSWEPVGFLC